MGEGELLRLLERTLPYMEQGGHLKQPRCSIYMPMDSGRCTCGRDELIKEIKEALHDG